MTMNADDQMFDDMYNAPPPGRTGNGIKVEGDFLFEVVSSKGNKGHWGPRFCLELKVLESSNPAIPVGCTRSWTAKWGDKTSFSDIKAFALAALAPLVEDLPQKDKEAQATFAAYAAAGNIVAGPASDVARKKLGDDSGPLEGDPFQGLKVRASTKPKKTQGGFDFTQFRWSAA